MKQATSTATNEPAAKVLELKAMYRTEEYWKFTKETKEKVREEIVKAIPFKDNPEFYGLLMDYPSRESHYSRPMLLVLTALSLSEGNDKGILSKAVELGAIIQLSEEWILVHDDIMDGATLRRGKPTLNSLVGPEIALLVGDVLHNAMAEAMHRFAVKYGATGEKIYEEFNDSIGNATALGQYLDLKFSRLLRNPGAAGKEFYYDIVKGKTVEYTVKGPMVLAAMLAGKGPDTIEALANMAAPAGIAFQINDDILDMAASKKFGKQQYGDLYEGKLTLIIQHAYNNATKEERERILGIYKKERTEKTKEDIDYLVEAIAKYGSIAYAERRRDEAAAEAQAQLLKYANEVPMNKYSSWLLATLLMLYERD